MTAQEVSLSVLPRIVPPLDPDFLPACLWNKAYRNLCGITPGSQDFTISIGRPDGAWFRFPTRILPPAPKNLAANTRYVERLVKFLLWQSGGSRVVLTGDESVISAIRKAYGPLGARRFEWKMLGEKAYREPMIVLSCVPEDLPPPNEGGLALGRRLDGCRIGFDLGGSDRKCAAVVDGQLIYSEEIRWNPYFQKDPRYHFDGIRDSIRRAAERLPRVDAIGGCAAGIYVNNEPRVASLFRGVAEADFEAHVRPLFHRLRQEWGNVPFEVVNDGAVTALAGSMSLGDNAVLGLALGTSLAAGYCDPAGHVGSRLSELSFAPIDYRVDAPVDEWSGDAGCGVQYLSQHAVARLAPRAGIEFPADMPQAEKLVEVQQLMARGDRRPRRIYETIGTYLGYAIAHYAEFYELRHVLILGRVTSGEGGAAIIDRAREVLDAEFPERSLGLQLHTPDEQLKRHGQAMAAASLPRLKK